MCVRQRRNRLVERLNWPVERLTCGEMYPLRNTQMMRIVLLLAVSLAFITSAQTAEQPKEAPKGAFQVPKLDQAAREAIIAAADQAISKHLKAEKKKNASNEIDAEIGRAHV